MSRKIVEFFKTIPKEFKMEMPKEYQQCQVVLEDIREEIANGRVGDFKIRPITDKDKKLDKKSRKVEHKCTICVKKFEYASRLSKHMIHFHPEQLKGLLECQICQKKFLKMKLFEQHMKIKHFDGKIQFFECDFCGKMFKTKSEMYIHMKVHLPTVNCYICDAELKQRTITSHIKTMHETDQIFQCQMCPKMFKTRSTLHNHEKIHDKKFQCTACMKIFSMKCTLLRHQKENHENPGSYSCEICDKKFNTKICMKRHLRVHDRYRSKHFKCNRCAYTTDEKGNFKRHQKNHTRQDEKFAAMKNPLKCPKCPKFYIDKDALTKHLKAVHPDEPFQCDLCGRYLKVFSSLKDHLKLLHQ